jgi:flavin-binding protein dodecin
MNKPSEREAHAAADRIAERHADDDARLSELLSLEDDAAILAAFTSDEGVNEAIREAVASDAVVNEAIREAVASDEGVNEAIREALTLYRF